MRLLKFITLSKSRRLMINVAQVFSSYVVQVSLATIYILTLGIPATIPIWIMKRSTLRVFSFNDRKARNERIHVLDSTALFSITIAAVSALVTTSTSISIYNALFVRTSVNLICSVLALVWPLSHRIFRYVQIPRILFVLLCVVFVPVILHHDTRDGLTTPFEYHCFGPLPDGMEVLL